MSDILKLIDIRIADLNEANDVFKKMSWDKSSDINRNEREIDWLKNLKFAITEPAVQPTFDGLMSKD